MLALPALFFLRYANTVSASRVAVAWGSAMLQSLRIVGLSLLVSVRSDLNKVCDCVDFIF